MQIKLILPLSALSHRLLPVRCRFLTGRYYSRSGLLILVTCIVLLLITFSSLSHALDGGNLPVDNIYINKPTPGPLENLKALLTNLIMPNIPGAIMLLIMSSLFSGINFYTAVQSKRRPFRVMARYLAAWIFFNYLFALLILLLILPNDLNLSTINKTLFVYCLVATAMPEIAANLRLQVGNSTNTIDLYKYKTKVSDLITEHLGTSVAEQRSKELMALAFFYYGRLDNFLDKLAIFRNQENLSNEEISDIVALSEKLKERPVEGRASRVVELEREHHKIIPKLIQFFRNDIRSFYASPVANLMDNLHPMLGIDEARKLVAAGVTNPRSFLWRCRFMSIRKRIAETTGIKEDRLSLLYHTTRVTKRNQILSRIRWLSATATVFTVVIFVMYWIQVRSYVDFIPNEDIKGHIVSKQYTPDNLKMEGELGQKVHPKNSTIPRLNK